MFDEAGVDAESGFRSSDHFRWLYQTDGWEGYQDEEVEEILTRPREQKSWHVPDEQIKAMVEEVGHRAGVPESLLQHAKCRRPRNDGSWDAFVQDMDGAEMDDNEAQQVMEPVRRSSTMRRSVRFEENGGDALDRMLKHEEEMVNQPGYALQEPERRKKWMISDEEFREFVLSLAKSNSEKEQAPTLRSSASAPLLKGSLGAKNGSTCSSVLVHIYFVDSQDIMSLRLSPDLRIGPPQAPKGNRFTDIYGLGANTKGFAELKKFDYQRRQWLGGFRKDWVPAWSVSLKGMISELTGMEIARQRLFCKGIAMSNDNLTLRSWRVRDGDTLQLRFQHKISQEQMEAVRKACEAAAGRPERSITSINDPSLPVRAEMESSTSSDFWKPWMGRQPAETKSRTRKEERQDRPQMLKQHSSIAQLRNSKHLQHCTSKSDVWMMPRWVSQHEPHHFAATGNPKHHVLNREPESFAERGIYLSESSGDLGRVRKSVGVTS